MEWVVRMKDLGVSIFIESRDEFSGNGAKVQHLLRNRRGPKDSSLCHSRGNSMGAAQAGDP